MNQYQIRLDACRLAAHAAQGQCGDGPIAERLWSLCVFFETYLINGSEGTREDFGYKDPVSLKAVPIKNNAPEVEDHAH